MADANLTVRPVSDRQSRGLRQAASTVFVLTAVLPLLIFTYTLYRVHVINEPYAQIGLVLALFVAVLGFVVFRAMMAEVSDLIQALGTVATKRESVHQPVASPTTPVASAATPSPTAPVTPTAQTGNAETQKRRPGKIAGVGEVRELGDIDDAIAAVWQREASTYLGRSVVVSVLKARPITGTLVSVTANGVLLEHGGEQVTIDYRRLAGIEPPAARDEGRGDSDSVPHARPTTRDPI